MYCPMSQLEHNKRYNKTVDEDQMNVLISLVHHQNEGYPELVKWSFWNNFGFMMTIITVSGILAFLISYAIHELKVKGA